MINVDAPRSFTLRRCPVCRHRPDGRHEHEDMLADLTVVWWVIAHGRIRRTRYCVRCAPKNVFTSIDCVHCGDGPIVVVKSELPSAHAVLRTALDTSGWNRTPAGRWVCGHCQAGG
jgi:hypothetical protein